MESERGAKEGDRKIGSGARTSTKMWLSGLVLLLSVSSAACFNIDIAPPKFGLRRLFRRPYRGPICVIEIIGAELNPRANRGTACPINRAPSHVLSLASGCATRRACEPLTQHVLAADSATRTGGLDWRSPFGLLAKGMPDLRVEWTHGSVSGETQVGDCS